MEGRNRKQGYDGRETRDEGRGQKAEIASVKYALLVTLVNFTLLTNWWAGGIKRSDIRQ